MSKKIRIGIFLTAALVFASISLLQAGAGSQGQEIFLAKKCNLCHAVSTVGIEAKTKLEAMAGPDLKGVASRHEAAWIGSYLQKECELNGAQHKNKFKGTDEELKTLIDWLLEQR